MRASNWLKHEKKYISAAVASIINKKDKSAEKWLLQHNFPYFLNLAKAIQKKIYDEQDDDIFGIITKFVKSLKKIT